MSKYKEDKGFSKEQFYNKMTLEVFKIVQQEPGSEMVAIRNKVHSAVAQPIAHSFRSMSEQESQSSKEIIGRLSKDESKIRGLTKQLNVLSKIAVGKPNIEVMMGKIRDSALQMKGEIVIQCANAVKSFNDKSNTVNSLSIMPNEPGADQNVNEVLGGITKAVCQYSGPGYDLVARSSFIGLLDLLSENGEDLFKNLFPKDVNGNVQVSKVASKMLGVNPELQTYEGKKYIALDSDFYQNSIFGRDEQSQKAFLQVVEFYNHNFIDKELTPQARLFADVVLGELKEDFRQNSLAPQYNFDREKFFSKCVTKTEQIIEKSHGASRSVPGASPATTSVSPLALNRGVEVLSPA